MKKVTSVLTAVRPYLPGLFYLAFVMLAKTSFAADIDTILEDPSDSDGEFFSTFWEYVQYFFYFLYACSVVVFALACFKISQRRYGEAGAALVGAVALMLTPSLIQLIRSVVVG